jgi:hypothetical protein
MASPHKPAVQARLALTDPNKVQEVFVNNVAGIQVRDDGTAFITLSVIRPSHDTVSGAAGEEQVVAARITCPHHVLGTLATAFGQIQTAQKMRANGGMPN